MSEQPTPAEAPAPVFVNDVQTTTYTSRRIMMQLDAADQWWTLARLQDFVTFALNSGAALDERVAIGQGYASVMRQAAVDEASTPPTP